VDDTGLLQTLERVSRRTNLNLQLASRAERLRISLAKVVAAGEHAATAPADEVRGLG
jgi:hypothetical protein